MSVTLNQILSLVGRLDDAAGDDVPRERLRRYLRENVDDVGQVRDYVEECLRIAGEQYSRALQDLVNYIGHFLGFEVVFGRYQGVQGQIGFDGHWISPKGFHIVIEVKTTEVYAIKTATLVGYVDGLISDQRISNWENALGFYVVGRPDAEIRQLENAIIAEKRTHQLRVVSVESLLSLAELMNEYDISHEDILAILRPSGPKVDPIVDLMARLVAQQVEPPRDEPVNIVPDNAMENVYWLTPVKSDDEASAEEVIRTLVGQEKIYAFGDRTPGRRHLKSGDWICFYATTIGVVAHAQVTSAPEKRTHRKIRHPEKYPWVFDLSKVKVYWENPIVLDDGLRSKLDVFRGREPDKPWAWFVQATRKVDAHDFEILTRREAL